MTPLESAIFDLIRSSRGDVQPLDILLAEVRIQPGFSGIQMHQVELVCSSLARQSKIRIGPEGAKLRHQAPKREPQGRLF